jgi:hypothetical protein
MPQRARDKSEADALAFTPVRGPDSVGASNAYSAAT